MCKEYLGVTEVDSEECRRLEALNYYEEMARSKGLQCIVGVDEVGRGPLAGPVIAAACLIPEGIFIPQINDSKKLTPRVRRRLFDLMCSDKRIMYAIGIIDSKEIDHINIYQATIQAMKIAISLLPIQPDCLLVDGMHLPDMPISCTCMRIVKGDSLSQTIAAASIFAKETRDQLMCQEYHQKWPQYGFDKHKGYGTRQHLEALAKYGPCDIHRRSFEPCKG